MKTKKPSTKTKRKWAPNTSDFVYWNVPGFRAIVKQEFLAHAKKHRLTAAGLLENVLVDYLSSQGIVINDDSKITPPTPPSFTAQSNLKG